MPAGGERVFAQRDGRRHRHGFEQHQDAAKARMTLIRNDRQRRYFNAFNSGLE
jgi:predicted DNA-binding WGR domain protein